MPSSRSTTAFRGAATHEEEDLVSEAESSDTEYSSGSESEDSFIDDGSPNRGTTGVSLLPANQIATMYERRYGNASSLTKGQRRLALTVDALAEKYGVHNKQDPLGGAQQPR